MWPTSRVYIDSVKSTPNVSQQQSNSSVNQTMSSVDKNQLLMAADSLRSIFGDNISNKLLSIRDSPSGNRMDTSLSQMTSRRPPERHVIDYENANYSRLDRSRLSQMSSDFESTDRQFNDSPPLRTDSRFYDPSKMPQKSILKKTKDQSFEQSFTQNFETTAFRSIEEEDLYLYGNPSSAGGLPPGIVTLAQNDKSPVNERPLSPISLRLKREMEKMDRNKLQTDSNEDNLWTPHIGRSNAPESNRSNEWVDDEEHFRRKYSNAMNPSPDRSLELEKVRIQQLAAIQAGILTQNDNKTKRREISPKRNYRRNSPELNPKRIRRRSPSLSPRRRRSISPRRLSRSPPKRSISPSNRRSHRSRSRSRDRYRRRSRSRSRSPPRRPNPPNNQMNLINPMPPMMPIPHPGMPFMRPPHPQNLVGVPMGPLMGQFIRHPMSVPYPPFVAQNMPPNIPNNISKQPQRTALKTVPIDKIHSPNKNPIEKKEDKLLNPHDLLVAERAKLKEELEALKKQYLKKKEEQELVVKKDGGTDSYVYRQLDKAVKELSNEIDSKQEKMIKNFELINEVHKSKSKAKQVVEQLKSSGDISKVDLKKKGTTNKSKESTKSSKSPEKKSQKEEKTKSDDEEEDEKSSRFHYFDSGPHWCKECNKFVDNMKQYFTHIHSKDHLSKDKDSLKTPWITKEYTKQMEKQMVRNKDQLVVASKGIHFILPTHGFFCELCDHFLHDSYEAEKHFKSAKHNRSYTRYTLLHNDYEHKWKAERDRAFTEMKKKERELEKEKSKKDYEKKIEDRKRLEEDIKRKDREVKEKIKAMNQNLKSVKELDDPKTDHKKDDKTKSSPKSSIRLNLSSSKTSNDSTEKTKSSEKNMEKKDKPKDKSKESSNEKQNKLEKMEDSMETSEDIGDMLIIDEINCEDNENKNSDENINENTRVLPLIKENVDKICTKIDEILEKSNNTEDNSIEVMDTSAESDVKVTEDNSNTNLIEINEDIIGKSDDNSNAIEGVMPATNATINCGVSVSLNVCEQISGDKPQSNDDSNDKTVPQIKTTEIVSTTDENTTKETSVETQESSNVCDDTQTMTYAEVVAKGSNDQQLKDIGLKSVKLEDTPVGNLQLNDCNGIKEQNIGINSEELDTKPNIKIENMFDIDLDIENFNERLKNFDDMVKKECVDTELEEEDPLDGFDVIDETCNVDNDRSEDTSHEVIDLSD